MGYVSGLITKLEVVSPGVKTTVDGAKITCEFDFLSAFFRSRPC